MDTSGEDNEENILIADFRNDWIHSVRISRRNWRKTYQHTSLFGGHRGAANRYSISEIRL